MSLRGGITAIDFDGERVSVVHGIVGAKRVDLKSWVTLQRPVEVGTDDPQAVGQWLREQLKEAKISSKKVIVSLPRGEAMLKELPVAGAGELPPAELHELVRLQMARHATISGDQTEIDYLAPEAGSVTDETVVAGAVPKPRVEWREKLVQALGGKLAAVELRASGARAVAVGASSAVDRALIVIAPGPTACEVLVVDCGKLVLARGIDIDRPGRMEDTAVYAKRIAIETSRTLVSYRVSAGASDIDSLVILGRDGLSEAVSKACAEQTGLESQCCGIPRDVVRGGEELSNDDAAVLVPVLGLLVRAALDLPALDFAHPTAAPDTGARGRQLVMASLFGLILIGGAGYVFAQDRLSDLDAQIEPLKETQGNLSKRYYAYVMNDARLRHLESWCDSGFDWLEHLSTIENGLPDPPQTLLETISFTALYTEGFKPGGSLTDPNAWTSTHSAKLQIGGAKNATLPGQEFRETMLESPTYSVHSVGPEEAGPGRFSVILTTTELSPVPSGSAIPQKGTSVRAGVTP